MNPQLLTEVATRTPYGSYGYSSSYGSSYGAAAGAAAGLAIGLIIFIVIMGLLGVAAAVLEIIGQWKMFKKAGKEGYIALIPVYSTITEMKMAGMPLYYWFINYCAIIPWIGSIGVIVFLFWKNIELAKAFGKGAGTGVLLTFFPYVMYPIIGLNSNYEYVGPNGEKEAVAEEPAKKETKKADK